MGRILVLRETSAQWWDTAYAPPIIFHMRALANWESLRLPAVSRRIRWKLTGFELGVHFPSPKKFQEKWF